MTDIGDKWHYIPQRLIKKERNGDPPGIPLYWDYFVNDEAHVAFLPKDVKEINVVFKHLDLKNPKWGIKENDGNKNVFCTSATAIAAKKLTKAELATAYVAARKKIDENAIARLQRDLRTTERQSVEQLRALTQTYEYVNQINEDLLKAQNGGDDKKYKNEFQTIQDLDLVSNIHIDNYGVLHITTKSLQAMDKTIYGNMTISINLSTGEVFQIMNESPIKSEYWGTVQHPYVHDSQGYICWGNMGKTIAQMQSRKDIVGLVVATIDFLQISNLDEQPSSIKRIQEEFQKVNGIAS